MATKIFYNDNRIIIDGHADTAEECKAITAMCDEMANSENFKTIIYEKGHAVFERIDGGDAMMFDALQNQLNDLSQYVKTLPTSAQFTALSTQVTELEERLAALEGKTEYTLPYTASELVEKLNAL